MEYIDSEELSPDFVCRGIVVADGYINMLNKIVGGRKQKTWQVFALFLKKCKHLKRISSS